MSKKQGKNSTIRFSADIGQVKTMADGGISVSLNLSENETEVAKLLMDCRTQSCVLEVVILPVGLIRNEEK